MINAPYDKEFVFHDGTRSKNISELVAKIESIGDNEFHQFVNDQKNDFANWIEQVLFDYVLAERLVSLRSKSDVILAIKDRIRDTTIVDATAKIQHPQYSQMHSNSQGVHPPRIENHISDSQISARTDVPAKTGQLIIGANVISAKKEDLLEARPKDAAGEKQAIKDNAVSDAVSDAVSNVVSTKKHNESDSSSILSQAVSHSKKLLEIFSVKRKSSSHNRSTGDIGAIIGSKKESDPEMESAGVMITETHENVLWVALYLLLVLLIVTLLVYKLFLS